MAVIGRVGEDLYELFLLLPSITPSVAQNYLIFRVLSLLLLDSKIRSVTREEKSVTGFKKTFTAGNSALTICSRTGGQSFCYSL
jgi:hypothetical protein